MKKTEIRVTIDSVEKHQRAIEILERYGERIINAKDSMDFWNGCNDLVCKNSEWFIITDFYNRNKITLDELEEMFKNEKK